MTGGLLQFEVPASTLAAALVLYATAPAHAVDVWQSTEGEAPAGDRLALRAVNLGEEPMTATLSFAPHAPLTIPGDPREITIPAGGTAALEVPVEGSERLEQPTLVTIRTAWPGGERESIAQLRPLLLNPALTIDADSDDTPDYWTAAGTTSTFARGVDGEGTWIQGLEDQYVFLRQEVALEPDTQYTFSAEIMRTAGEGNVSAAVAEHLDGGGLRMHQIGQEGEPDRWERFETTFTTGSEFRNVNVYLYNTHSTRRAWFRNLNLVKH